MSNSSDRAEPRADPPPPIGHETNKSPLPATSTPPFPLPCTGQIRAISFLQLASFLFLGRPNRVHLYLPYLRSRSAMNPHARPDPRFPISSLPIREQPINLPLPSDLIATAPLRPPSRDPTTDPSQLLQIRPPSSFLSGGPASNGRASPDPEHHQAATWRVSPKPDQSRSPTTLRSPHPLLAARPISSSPSQIRTSEPNGTEPSQAEPIRFRTEPGLAFLLPFFTNVILCFLSCPLIYISYFEFKIGI